MDRFVRSLAYIVFDVPDIVAWRSFAEDVLGMSVRDGADGALLVRADIRYYRIALYQSDAPGLRSIGWEVEDDVALKACADQLESSGIPFTVATEEQCAVRLVRGMLLVQDPNGVQLEIVHGHRWDVGVPFRSRNSSSIDGIGHIVLGVPDITGTVAFYRTVLGFKVTDYRPGTVYFLRCNDDHHAIGVAKAPRVRVGHISVDLPTVDDVGRMMDLARKRDLITVEIGRHSNDLALSFYMRAPSVCNVECATGGRTIDDSTWVAHEVTTSDLWGHQPRASAAGAPDGDVPMRYAVVRAAE